MCESPQDGAGQDQRPGGCEASLSDLVANLRTLYAQIDDAPSLHLDTPLLDIEDALLYRPAENAEDAIARAEGLICMTSIYGGAPDLLLTGLRTLLGDLTRLLASSEDGNADMAAAEE